jgi:hypothetical protein
LPPAATEHFFQLLKAGFFFVPINCGGFIPQFFFGALGALEKLPMLYTGSAIGVIAANFANKLLFERFCVAALECLFATRARRSPSDNFPVLLGISSSYAEKPPRSRRTKWSVDSFWIL